MPRCLQRRKQLGTFTPPADPPFAAVQSRATTGSGSVNSGESALQERHARGSVAVAAQVVMQAAAALSTEAAGVDGIPWPVKD